jgi:hypothetical protein
VDLPFPEGQTGRYVYFKNQIQYLGWNNQLNEVYVSLFKSKFWGFEDQQKRNAASL